MNTKSPQKRINKLKADFDTRQAAIKAARATCTCLPCVASREATAAFERHPPRYDAAYEEFERRFEETEFGS